MAKSDAIEARAAESWRCQELRRSCNVEASESVDEAATSLVIGVSGMSVPEQVTRAQGSKQSPEAVISCEIVLFLQ